MRRHQFSLLTILSMSLLLLLLFSLLQPEIGKAIEYRAELDDLARSFYAYGDVEGVLEALVEKESSLQKREDARYYLLQGEIEIFRGEVKMVAGSEDPYHHFSLAYELSQKSLELEETAQAKRLSGEALSQLFNHRSPLFILQNYREAIYLLESSRELDPNHPMTTLALGVYLINAPNLGGGDFHRGQKMLESLLEKEHPVFSFIILNILAQREGEVLRAERLKEARNIFPHSPWLDSNH